MKDFLWGLALGIALMGSVWLNVHQTSNTPEITAQQDTIKTLRKQLVTLREDSARRKQAVDTAAAQYLALLQRGARPVNTRTPSAPVRVVGPKDQPAPAATGVLLPPLSPQADTVIKACTNYVNALKAQESNCEQRAEAYRRIATADDSILAIMKRRDAGWHLEAFGEGFYDGGSKAIDPLVGVVLSKSFLDFELMYDAHYRLFEPAIGAHLRIF